MVNYPILSSFPTLTTLFPYLRFKAHLDHLMVFSLVYRGTRSWSWWCHQGLWCHYVMSELVIPGWTPFPTIIYEPILILFILTWSLHYTPPHQSQSCPQAEDMDFVLPHLPCSVLEYTLITLGFKPYPRMYFPYSGCVTWLCMVGLSLERPFKI